MFPPQEPKSEVQDEAPPELSALLDEVKRLEQRDPLRGVEQARAALALARQQERGAPPSACVLQALMSLCLALANTQAMPEALVVALEGLELAEALADVNKQVRLLNVIGNAYSALGLSEDALESWQQALERCHTHPDPELSDLILSNLAASHAEQGSFDQALELYAACLEGARSRQHLPDQAHLLNSIAYTRLEQAAHQPLERSGQLEQSHRALEASLALYRQLDDPGSENYALSTLAEWNIASGQIEAALELLPRLIVRCQNAGQPGLEGSMWVRLGEVCGMRREFGAALEHLRRGLGRIQAAALCAQEFEAHLKLSQLYEAMENPTQALHHFKLHHTLGERLRSEQILRQMQAFQVRHGLEVARREAEFQRRRAEELEDLSRRDGLTGLYNRRHLEVQLAQTLLEVRARGAALSVIVLDVDHFKEVNDHFAHAVGDHVLRTLAGLLEGWRLEGEVCARYGGEEFVVILPGVAAAGGLERCEQLCRQVEAFDWDAIAPGLRLTVSIGFCDDPSLHSPEEMLHCADLFLYQAKREGRNRVHPAAP